MTPQATPACSTSAFCAKAAISSGTRSRPSRASMARIVATSSAALVEPHCSVKRGAIYFGRAAADGYLDCSLLRYDGRPDKTLIVVGVVANQVDAPGGAG